MLESSLSHLLACNSPLVPSALSLLCSTRPHPLTVAPALPYLVDLLSSDDAERCADALVALTHLCSKPSWLPFVVTPGDAYVCGRVVALLGHPRPWVYEPDSDTQN